MALMAAGGIAASQKDAIGDTGTKLIDIAKVAAVQLELAQIRTAFVTEMAFGKARAAKKDFRQFIRDSMTAKRDPSLDFWDNPYTLDEYADHYEIVSFGPDGEEETDDDIWVEVQK
jgi:hypothetical protein